MDAVAQVEEVLWAVITVYVRDAFDRLRERPVRVVAVNGAALAVGPGDERLWGKEPVREAMVGRVRFLRVLRRRGSATNGEARGLGFPGEVFGPGGPDLDMNPPDADEIIVGISRPIELKARSEAVDP